MRDFLHVPTAKQIACQVGFQISSRNRKGSVGEEQDSTPSSAAWALAELGACCVCRVSRLQLSASLVMDQWAWICAPSEPYHEMNPCQSVPAIRHLSFLRQAPKPILLDTGRVQIPYAWQPAITEISIFRVGQVRCNAVATFLNAQSRVADLLAGHHSTACTSLLYCGSNWLVCVLLLQLCPPFLPAHAMHTGW